MKYIYRKSEIFYEFIDNGCDVTNVFLHGWGCDHKSLLFCKDFLKEQNNLFIDFPPFGESGEIREWSIFTYANMVISLCQHLNIKKFNLFGHSFGGRVAIIIAMLNRCETQKLVLIDSAGLKPKRNLRYYFKVFNYKIRKKLKLDVKNCGSGDYKNLSNDMKQIFVSIVNTHLDDFLPFICAETLILFGKNDATTPIYMAKKLHKKIKNSKLVIIDDAGHFPFLDRRIEFVSQIEDFIEG